MLDEFTRAQRRRYLGSSDMAAIIGKDPWGRTAGDVFCEKTGRIANIRDTVPMALGSYLEPAILSWTEDQLETPLQRDQFVIHAGGILAANLDALAPHNRPPAVVEAKSAGLIGRPHYLEEFGTPGTDEVPMHVMIQVQHQMACLEQQPGIPPIAHAIVPALLIGRGFVLYRVEKHQGLVEALVEEGERFWHDHVEANMPPREAPSLRTLQRLLRVTEPSVALDP